MSTKTMGIIGHRNVGSALARGLTRAGQTLIDVTNALDANMSLAVGIGFDSVDAGPLAPVCSSRSAT